MARFSRLRVLRSVLEDGLVPLFYEGDVEVARGVVGAVAAGGGRILEFTNRGDFAPEVFAELQRHCRAELPQFVLGVGTVTDSGTAAQYLNLGAEFVVSPTFDADVAALCNRRKVPYLPGGSTLTEIVRAEEHGCEIVKVFPGTAAGGPGFVKAVRGPMPRSLLMPTGGVDTSEESLRAWFGAGAGAVGIGSQLISKQVVADRDWDGLAAHVRTTLATIHQFNGTIREAL